MALEPTDTPITSASTTPEPPAEPTGPVVPVSCLAAAAWVYGALLDRAVIRGHPRDPEIRREVNSIRAALVRVLPSATTDAEMKRAGDLSRHAA